MKTILVLCAVGIAWLFISNSGKSFSVSGTPPTVTTVSLSSLFAQYDTNKLAAQNEWTGQTIKTTGTVQNISQDIMGNYFVALESGASATTLQCFDSNQGELLGLHNGQSVTVKGDVDDMTIGIIPLKNCSVVSN